MVLAAMALAGQVIYDSTLPLKLAVGHASIDSVAECLVRTAPRLSAGFLTSAPMSDDEAKRGYVLLHGHNGCLHEYRSLRISMPPLRGAVAGAYFFYKHVAMLDQLAARPPRPIDRPRMADGRPFLMAYAGCLVATAPARSVALLRTVPHSPMERTAFVAYGDTLKACMPEGASYRVDLPALRDEIASTAYLATANEGAG